MISATVPDQEGPDEPGSEAMQISIETTTQSTSLFSASFSNGGAEGQKNDPKGNAYGHEIGQRNGHDKSPAVSVLEAASKQAEEDAVVIAALQDAVEKGKGNVKDDDEDKDGALATVEDYQKTAGKLKAALGEEESGASANVAYESATISTTTIEAEIGGETVSAQFVSFERVSYDSETGLSVRSANASSVEGNFDNGSFSYQSAAVSELYAGTGDQVSNLLGLVA
ncbi:hypothetical protein FMN63_18280 [Stappia sp. BW2]|jgi:hypothetical protein|uniref:hypothetical protein n=1 Tax=Stappia sp. BW2 TaxID=2592622 RepID=UPI0011DE7F3C|nr:hypothetical protein [Stappia sp. BW2]TYC67978.1 hypothetical protein FMN63_18280 [Stappia sp. BW2]